MATAYEKATNPGLPNSPISDSKQRTKQTLSDIAGNMREDDRYTDGMSDDKRENYKNLRASPKNWSRSEAREMATNPSKRLPKVKSRAERRYGGSAVKP